MKYIGIDIGATWIKGAVVFRQNEETDADLFRRGFSIMKIRNTLHCGSTSDDLIEILQKITEKCQGKFGELDGIGISTPGIINYHGTKVLKVNNHLRVLKNTDWRDALSFSAQCSVTLINDADAATIGLAESGGLSGNKAVGIMPIGTGLGFSVWRNSRRWNPGKLPALLGSINTPNGDFDFFASAANLAGLDEANDLTNVLTNPLYDSERTRYLQWLKDMVNNAALLYHLDEIILCGGLAEAAIACQFPLEEQLELLLKEAPPALDKPVKVAVSRMGNKLQLIGALALTMGNTLALKNKIIPEYRVLDSEIPYRENLRLERMTTLEIVETLWQAEQEAGGLLKDSMAVIAEIIEESLKRMRKGGRIIYVGAGSSGRIATMDAVEVPCFGFAEDRIFAIVAGGISDAAIEIESDFEEDASAVPEMLLMHITANDVVIGISASGSAYYVQSALIFAKSRGALSVIVQNNLPEKGLPFCDIVLPLHAGHEVVAGSTRMKAGTATKKVLNFISTTVMAKLGKVEGAYLVDVSIINNKLTERALRILKILYHIDRAEALALLEENEMQLGVAINTLKLNSGGGEPMNANN